MRLLGYLWMPFALLIAAVIYWVFNQRPVHGQKNKDCVDYWMDREERF